MQWLLLQHSLYYATYMIKHSISILVFGLIIGFNVALAQSTHGNQWKTNFEAATTEAKASDRPVLMVFAGSDWCKPCIMLRKEVWESDSFMKYAQDNLILVELDFPRMKKNQLSAVQTKQNESLAAKYNKEGIFPLVVLTDANGNVIAKTGYKPGGPDKYIAHLKEIQKK
jgi:thioredoxin-related protein